VRAFDIALGERPTVDAASVPGTGLMAAQEAGIPAPPAPPAPFSTLCAATECWPADAKMCRTPSKSTPIAAGGVLTTEALCAASGAPSSIGAWLSADGW